MVAFSYRAHAGSVPRGLTMNVARYTPQAVLIANVEEARYDALIEEEGKTIVRARYAVRNNQRAFLGVTLPAARRSGARPCRDRPLRPGVAADGALLLPLEKGRAGEETPAFVVELTYVQRVAAWADKGRATLALPGGRPACLADRRRPASLAAFSRHAPKPAILPVRRLTAAPFARRFVG